MEKTFTDQDRERTIYRVTIVGSVGNLLLLVFKFIAGFVGNSAAMVADAVHSLSDFITDIIVLVFVRIANKPQDKSHDYGHGKYETLATAIIALLLGGVGVMLLVGSAKRIWLFFHHGVEIPQPGMVALVAAALSIIVKEALYHYTIHYARLIDSPTMQANAWHHRSDALSSIGTLVGIGGAILLGQRYTVLDPLAAAVVSVLIIKVALDILLQSLNDLLEHSLSEETENEILDIVARFPEISNPHNLRTRRIGTRCAMDLHIRMDGSMTVHQSHTITLSVEQALREHLGQNAIINLHVEPTM